MAMIAAHLGVVDEDAINNMRFVFFEDVLRELNQRLTYDAVVNYAGNAFFEKSWDVISEHHPFLLKDGKPEAQADKVMSQLANLFGGQGPTRK